MNRLATIALCALVSFPVLPAQAADRSIRVEPAPVKKPTRQQASAGRKDAMKAATSGLLVEGSAPPGFRDPKGGNPLKTFEDGASKVFQRGGEGAVKKLGNDIQTRLRKKYGARSEFTMGKPGVGADGRTTATFDQQIQQKDGGRKFVGGSVTLAGGANP